MVFSFFFLLLIEGTENTKDFTLKPFGIILLCLGTSKPVPYIYFNLFVLVL